MKLDYRIESQRLEIRPLSKGDFSGFKAIGVENRNLRCSFLRSRLKNEKTISKIFKLIMNQEVFQNGGIFSIYSKLTEEFIGLNGIDINFKDLEGKIFYILLSRYFGNGFAIESINLLFKVAFLKQNLNLVFADIPSHLKSAWKPVERAGMRYVGDFQDHNLNSRVLRFKINKKEYLNQRFY